MASEPDPAREDLLFANDVLIPVIDALYRRGKHQPATIDGIRHLADIVADEAETHDTKQDQHPKIQTLLDSVFGPSRKFLGTVLGLELGLGFGSKFEPIFGSIDLHEATHTGIIAFRGAETEKDWLDSFDLPPAHFVEVSSDPLVHDGFHKVYKLVRQNLFDQLGKLEKAHPTRIVVTGHSLGAAVATLAALDLTDHKLLPALEVCTFGSPRTFFLTAKAFDDAVPHMLRLYNGADPVVHAPFAIPMGYTHVHGGCAIGPILVEPHDLDKAYAPAIAAKLAATTTKASA